MIRSSRHHRVACVLGAGSGRGTLSPVAGMSQQFLSKYFKSSSDTSEKARDTKQAPLAKKGGAQDGRHSSSKCKSDRDQEEPRQVRQKSTHAENKLTQEGSREESRNGGAGDDKRRRSRSRDRIDDTGGNDEPKGLERSTNNDALGEEGRRKAGGWRCGHCTFQNASDTGQACAMCGHTRVIATTATAGCSPAPFKKRTVQEEIEISSSDDGEILAAAPAGARDKSYSDDSDVEDEPIGHHRKRARTGNNGHGNLVANATQKRRESNESPAVSKPKQTARANGRSPSPQSARSSGKDRSTGTARQDTSSSSSESADMQEVGKHSKGDDQRPAAVATPFSLSRHQRTGGERPVPEVVVSPRSFDLQEDAVRRKNFQEGLIVSLREDTGDRSIPEAGRVGDQGGEGSAEEGTAPSAAAAADSNESSGKTKAAALRRKGKGKAGGAAGRVKLTPMEQQVSDLKAQHPGVLLLVECGYRYRFFGDDALIAAKVLRIYSHLDHNFQVASVPTFRLAVHLRRLVDAGHKVGVVRQAESAALKAAGLTETGKKSGTFKRELAAVFSQATWVEGTVEGLMPPSASTSTGGGAAAGGSSNNAGGGNGSGKGGGQGSWRKVGGAWRRVGGWGKSGGGRGNGSDSSEGVFKEEKPAGEGKLTEADMDNPVIEVDHERAEQWLVSVYEEDASPGVSDGEPISISLALRDGSEGGRIGRSGGEDAADTVRVGLVAVDVRTGKVVHDTFVERLGQRQELDTRLRHLRPLELLAPGPRLSKATETTLARYCKSAVDARGSKRVVRMERLPPEDFCFDAAQRSLSAYYSGKDRRKRNHADASSQAKGVGRGEDGVPALTRVLDLTRPVICGLGPLVSHLERFGLDRALASPCLVSFSQSQYMTLDAVTLRDLEETDRPSLAEPLQTLVREKQRSTFARHMPSRDVVSHVISGAVVLQCQADGREAGSLFSVVDHTRTTSGRRVLAGWIRQPLLSPEDITARQDAVEELVTDPPPVMERLRPALRDLKDLDPAIASLHHRKIQPSRLLSLLDTMRKVFAIFHPANGGSMGMVSESECSADANRSGQARCPVLLEALAGIPANMTPVIKRYLGELDAGPASADDYVRALVDGESLCKELAEAGDDEEAAKAGLEKELQAVRQIVRKPSLQWKSLRTGVTSTVEYLVELRKAEAKKLAPASWMQVSQTKDLSRFHTPEVLRLQQELLRARESRIIAARKAWAELIQQVDEDCYESFRVAVHALGTLDALLSLAAVAKLPGYVRPKYRSTRQPRGDGGVTSDELQRSDGGDEADQDGGEGADAIVLRGARHPTVERVLEGGFVPNDVDLRRGECLVITGPNMGGKSSTVRMVALLCIMGQMGCHVPADSADMYCLDGVYTRMGAGDDLAADMSTFMVELWHTSYILRHATRRSLVVLDELGRGTSTHDGVAIALATLRHVVLDLGCATLFVTHYPQVADLASDKTLSGKVKNAHMSFIENTTSTAEEQPSSDADGRDGGSKSGEVEGRGPEQKGEAQGVTFLYQLVIGQAYRSYGLNVARAAGMDEDMIKLAAIKSAEMRNRSHEEG